MDDKLIITKPFFFLNSRCGYCEKENSSSFGFDCEQITPEQYDSLITDGFRRSGDYIYKPDLITNCCKYFTIRTSLGEFKTSKEYNKIVNKFNKFIQNEPNTEKTFHLNNELDKILNGNADFTIKYETNEITPEKYQLFKKYQEEIHNDKKVSEKSFDRFLCADPFTTQGSVSKDYKYEKGAIHQCYYYKDQLIAIGVLDILPTGVSSVYFIYDPEYKRLELGKLSTLLEMRVSSRLGLKYYYLGFYIPNIVKMKYKKRYGGELLDPVLSQWFPFSEEDEVVERLDLKLKELVRTEEELKDLKKNHDHLPRAILGEHDDDIDYQKILVFDIENRKVKRGGAKYKELVNLKRIIGKLSEDSIVKVW